MGPRRLAGHGEDPRREARGVIPAHLTGLSPDEICGFYPGVTYQLGNLLAALNLPLQTSLADAHSPSFALLVVIVPVLVVVIVLTALGSEDHSARFGAAEDEEAREPFTTDRFRREGAPAPERLRTQPGAGRRPR